MSQAFAPLQLTMPLQPLAKPLAAHGASPERLKKTAHDFETSVVSSLLQPMFQGLSTAPPFGGGEGEAAFRSFLIEAMAKQIGKTGGLKLAPTIERELIRLQAGGK